MYVATMLVTVSGKPNRHAIMVSTIAEKHCLLGKMIDSSGTMRPVYIEVKDTLACTNPMLSTRSTKALFVQRVGHDDFAVEAAEVYELVRA